MPLTSSNDAIDLLTEDIPYEPANSPLVQRRHLRRNSVNMWMPTGGYMAKRPGFSTFGNALGANLKINWATVSEAGTIAASVLNTSSGLYIVYYRKTGGSWTNIANKQLVNESTTPHEMVWVGSELYVRGTPNANVLGSAVYNEDTDVTTAWGAYNPTMAGDGAPVFTSSAGWNSSGSDTVAPLLGARYAYTYVWESGQESSRSAFSDKSPIVSGKYPAMTLPNPNNLDNITHLNIYRSADGGGALWFIEQLEIGVDTPDPASFSTFTYEDQNFIPGGNFTSSLNFSRPAPTLTSNDPPPTIESGVVLTDYPPERSSPIAFFRGRLYMAMGGKLYFSVNDEAVPASGLLLHSFRAGSFAEANFAQIQDDVVDLYATEDALYIGTKKNIYRLTGELRAEIRVRLAYPGVGVYDRRCFTSVASTLFWLDQNREMRSASPGTQLPMILSGVLGQEHITASRRYSLHAIYYKDYVWVVMAIVNESDPDDTVLYVYDAARQFWFPPWFVSCDAIWDFFGMSKGTAIGQIDSTVGSDLGSGFGNQVFFNGNRVPGGNHINLLRAHATISVLSYMEIYWEGAEPTTTGVMRDDIDDFGGITGLQGVKSNPPESPEPTGYSRGHYWIDAPGDRFAPVIVVEPSTALWFLYGLVLVFEPTMGS